MTRLPAARREQILIWLQDEPMLTIDDMALRLGVSHMTIHRDLDALAQSGQVVKTHGGAARIHQNEPTRGTAACQVCQGAVQERSAFVIHTRRGAVIELCCAHCGLLALAGTADVASALARDFIYDRMVNCWQAHYVLDSDVVRCCVPSVLCFASESDALRFQRGFGGVVMTCAEAQHHLSRHHEPHHH